jgi:hypothetical protein
MQERELAELFAEARATAPQPSAALLARIEADAASARPAGAPARPVSRPSGGALARWLAGLGGGAALAGLASAAVAGIWLGVAQPAPVSAITGRVAEAFGQDSAFDYVELIPSFDALATEG